MNETGHDPDRMVIGQRLDLETRLILVFAELLLVGGGLFVVMIGIGELAAPEWLHSRLTLVSTEPTWLMVALSFSFGLACISLGLWGAFSFRGDVILNRRDRTVTQRRGFLVAFRRIVRSFDGFEKVLITIGYRGAFCCDVWLEGHEGEWVFIWTDQDVRRAASKARTLASFLDLPVHDEAGRIQ